MLTLAGNNQVFHPNIIGRAFSIFRQETDSPNPSELEIKVFIAAPKYCVQSWYYEFP